MSKSGTPIPKTENNVLIPSELNLVGSPLIGNAGSETTELTADELARLGTFRRTSDAICAACGKSFADHPFWQPSAKTNFGVPWLREICGGRLVKL